MSEHKAIPDWQLNEGNFLKGRFSRKHTWTVDGGLTVPASPSPAVVPAPFSEKGAVDPEEAYVASIAGCQMLTFLYLARGRNLRSRRTRTRPSPEEEEQLHHAAHEQCFIANSVKTEITVRH